MTKSMDIKWKDSTYTIKMGTILLFGKPSLDMKNAPVEHKDTLFGLTVFAGVVLDITPELDLLWVYAVSCFREDAVIDTIANHGVTLKFQDGDKWLITPEMAANLIKTKVLDLVDYRGNRCRSLIPDNTKIHTLRLSGNTIEKWLPTVGTNERLMNLTEWPASILNLWASIQGIHDPKLDTMLSKKARPTFENVIELQKLAAIFKRAEKFNSEDSVKCPSPKLKVGVKYTYRHETSDTSAVRPLTTQLDFRQLLFTTSPSRQLGRDAIIGCVGPFPAVKIAAELVPDPDICHIDLSLPSLDELSAIHYLEIPGTVLCLGSKPYAMTINNLWNVSAELRGSFIRITIHGYDGGTDIYAMPIARNLPPEFVDIIGSRFPERVSGTIPEMVPASTSIPKTIRVHASCFAQYRDNPYNQRVTPIIETNAFSSDQLEGFRTPGTKIIIDEYGVSETYIVASKEFLEEVRDAPYTIIDFTSNGNPCDWHSYWIDWTSNFRDLLMNYLADREIMPNQPMISEIVLHDGEASVSTTRREIIVDYDAISITAAKRMTTVGTIFSIQQRRWKVIKSQRTGTEWTLKFNSTRRDRNIINKIFFAQTVIGRPVVQSAPEPTIVVDNYDTLTVPIDHTEAEQLSMNYQPADNSAIFWSREPAIQIHNTEIVLQKAIGGFTYTMTDSGKVYINLYGFSYYIDTRGIVFRTDAHNRTSNGYVVIRQKNSTESNYSDFGVKLAWDPIRKWYSLLGDSITSLYGSRAGLLVEFLNAFFGIDQSVDTSEPLTTGHTAS